MSSTTTTVAERQAGFDFWAYVQIARIDHWFKNVFMILGVVLAMFYRAERRVVVECRAAGHRGARHVPGRVEQLRAERAARRPERPAAPGEALSAGAVRDACSRRWRTPNGCCWRPPASASRCR